MFSVAMQRGRFLVVWAAAGACARASALLRTAPGALEGRAAPENLSVCHRPARPLRRAP